MLDGDTVLGVSLTWVARRDVLSIGKLVRITMDGLVVGRCRIKHEYKHERLEED